MFWKAARTSAALSLLFLVVYGGTNYLTSMRPDVGVWVYPWERYIPFVPAFTIPYLSIDLFFVVAPFLCRDESERRILARRIALAIVSGGVFFLVLPLRLGFQRTPVDGWLGAMFGQFLEMDKEYNLVPSLHVALCVILAETYSRRTQGIVRALVCFWFALIGISTLLTHQHQFVDAVGGLILACVCFYVVGATPLTVVRPCNRRVGGYYLVGCGLMLLAALWLRSWALWLIWPAMALAIAACGYFGLGAAIYRKQDGWLPLASRLVLMPVLLGQRVSLLHYAGQCRRWDVLTEHVWIGRLLADGEAREAIEQGATAVLDLTGEFSEATAFRRITYLNIAILDLTAPTSEQLDEAVAFIQEHSQRGIVYIHCKIGYSRTAAIAGAWMLYTGMADSPAAAMEQLHRARPSIIIRPEAQAAIEAFHARCLVSERLRRRLKGCYSDIASLRVRSQADDLQ